MGNVVPLKSTSTVMPLGTAMHNMEITRGRGGQLARAAGAVAKLIAKEGKSAPLRLPSGEVRLVSQNCLATVGQVGNVGVNQKSLGRAGSKCWLGKRHVVRGVVMNPVDHPHGGGEGKAPIGRKNPQPLGVILRLEEELGKEKNIAIVLFFVALSKYVTRNMENCIFGICNYAMGKQRELNPRKVDSQSTALIHLATSAPYPAEGFFSFFHYSLFYLFQPSYFDRDIGHIMPLLKREKE
ncbi:hypothetical protein VPH35_123332 [Triticum aestivum]